MVTPAADDIKKYRYGALASGSWFVGGFRE
jgi:hypothetical protein